MDRTTHVSLGRQKVVRVETSPHGTSKRIDATGVEMEVWQDPAKADDIFTQGKYVMEGEHCYFLNGCSYCVTRTA